MHRRLKKYGFEVFTFMNIYYRISVIVLLLCWLAIASCVNNIGGERSQPGDIPMTFTVKEIGNIHTNTKLYENSFEKEDEVGLFATFTDVDIDQDRYIDNLRLISNGESELIPERDLFYPESGDKLDIVAYYPYDKKGLEEGSSVLPVSVQSDQSLLKNLSSSDFLVARVEDAEGSEEPVELEFEHQMAKIEIVLSPSEDEDIDDMLEADPYIIASGFKTRAYYDFLSETFKEASHRSDIIPYGQWKKKDGKLIGKEFIVIPQDYDGSEQTLVMEWNGRVYTCPMPDIELNSNTVCEINIRAFQTAGSTLSNLSATIRDWEYTEKADSDTEYDLSTIRIASLSFKSSNIYRVYYENYPVAEVCKEYLLSDDASLASEAIVVYPVRKNEEPDLGRGVVLRLEGVEEDKHGGVVCWDLADNAFDYTEGTSAPITCFYIDESGAICLSKPTKPVHVNVKAYCLRDTRGGKLQEYPVVKVGTQYWMREDLRATGYRDIIGGELRRITELSGKAGYLLQGGVCFYSGETLLGGEMAPYGWKIPDADDWDKLIAYVHSDASVLKGGSWRGASATDEVFPATNLSGLTFLPNGYYAENDDKETIRLNYGATAVYWAGKKDGQDSLPNRAVFLMHKNNSISFGNNKVESKKYYRALNIRCIKK